MKKLQTPISTEEINNLHCGDQVFLSGIILTGRDAAHKWLYDTFISQTSPEEEEDRKVLKEISPYLQDGVIYHCGPVVEGLESGDYRFTAAGPTTSIREEPYQAELLKHFGLKGVIGKGGMGSKTLKGCQEAPAVYLHAVGGAAALIASKVKKVIGVYKLEFGVPEAIWVIEVQDFPLVVTMDAHGKSLHEEVKESSRKILYSIMEES